MHIKRCLVLLHVLMHAKFSSLYIWSALHRSLLSFFAFGRSRGSCWSGKLHQRYCANVNKNRKICENTTQINDNTKQIYFCIFYLFARQYYACLLLLIFAYSVLVCRNCVYGGRNKKLNVILCSWRALRPPKSKTRLERTRSLLHK